MHTTNHTEYTHSLWASTKSLCLKRVKTLKAFILNETNQKVILFAAIMIVLAIAANLEAII